MTDPSEPQQKPQSGLAAIGKGTVRSGDQPPSGSATPRRYGPGPPSAEGRSREPDWTTGQGIGFLVALPGCLLALVGLIGLMVADGSPGNYIFGSGFALGAIGAIPGTIVFTKCKRP